MKNSWLVRFADEPALVAPHMSGRFEQCLNMLEGSADADLLSAARADSSGDGFWTELGEIGSKRLRPYVVRDGVLLIPVKGVLLHDFPYQFFGWATGYEYIWKAVERGLDDDNVKGIAFVIDSPGGMVAGNFDLVDDIYAARGQKPLRAFAAESAYSAAYSIASVADSIVVSRTGGVGSIGVVTAHVDMSKAMADYGMKVTFIHFGKHKVDGNPYQPLPEDVHKRIQFRIDGLGELFVNTVARNRNLSAAAVRATEALTFTASEAIENGLADSVGALDGALAEFAAELNNPDAGDETMSDNKPAVTVESVKAEHPEVAKSLIAEGVAQGKKDAADSNSTAIADALKADRERVAEITGLACPGGEKIIAAGIANGESAGDVALKLMRDPGVKEAQKNASVLAGLQGDDASAAGAVPAADGDEKPEAANTPEGWKAEWEGASAASDIRKDHATAKDYVAYKSAVASGRVKVLSGKSAA